MFWILWIVIIFLAKSNSFDLFKGLCHSKTCFGFIKLMDKYFENPSIKNVIYSLYTASSPFSSLESFLDTLLSPKGEASHGWQPVHHIGSSFSTEAKQGSPVREKGSKHRQCTCKTVHVPTLGVPHKDPTAQWLHIFTGPRSVSFMLSSWQFSLPEAPGCQVSWLRRFPCGIIDLSVYLNFSSSSSTEFTKHHSMFGCTVPHQFLSVAGWSTSDNIYASPLSTSIPEYNQKGQGWSHPHRFLRVSIVLGF